MYNANEVAQERREIRPRGWLQNPTTSKEVGNCTPMDFDHIVVLVMQILHMVAIPRNISKLYTMYRLLQ